MSTSARSRAPAKSEAPESKAERPIETIRRWIGGANIDVAIFAKEHRTPTTNGGVYIFKTYFVAVGKSWKRKPEDVKEGEKAWGSSSAFNPHELLELADAIRVAHARCLELQKGEAPPPDGTDIPF